MLNFDLKSLFNLLNSLNSSSVHSANPALDCSSCEKLVNPSLIFNLSPRSGCDLIIFTFVSLSKESNIFIK